MWEIEPQITLWEPRQNALPAWGGHWRFPEEECRLNHLNRNFQRWMVGGVIGEEFLGYRAVCCSVALLCLTLLDPMDCSPPASSTHGIFQARVLEWGAIAFSGLMAYFSLKTKQARIQWVTYSKHWKKKITNQELCIQQNYPSKNKVNFTDKENLKVSVTSRLALQEI